MKSLLNRLVSSVKSFHQKEDGMEPLQVVMLLAIAAMVVIAIFTVGDQVIEWAKEAIDGMREEDGFDVGD